MKVITLKSEKELRIYSLPLRQKILREMQILGHPVTAKEVADRLNITPSAAQHHLKQLMSIGLVEPDHMEVIRGIQARYLRLCDVTVSIGQQYKDTLAPVRDEMVKAGLMTALSGFMRTVERNREKPEAENIHSLNDILTGIVHLTPKEADDFYQFVISFLNSHTVAGPDTNPWEVALLSYRMDLAQEE
jgi:DNA-binding transcriptional ArsR family regulator